MCIRYSVSGLVFRQTYTVVVVSFLLSSLIMNIVKKR